MIKSLPLCPTLPRAWARCVFLTVALAIAPVLSVAAPDNNQVKTFDVPVGDAVDTLKRFAQQAGREIMFPVETVRGVKTRAVQGEHTVREALRIMLADTGLTVVDDQRTGALTVSRAAPAERPRAQRPPESDEVVQLSRFEITTTEGAGYVSNNSVTGFKTHQELLNIPQAITVVTSDFINDIGATNASDILQYAGVSNFFRGESLAVRGARINNALIDEMPNGVPFLDNTYIDSFEVIRGPAAVLYRSNSLGGIVLKNTKKPLPRARREVTGKIDQHGTYRGHLDFTGPMGSFKNVKLGYRLIVAHQGGDSFFTNIEEEILAIHPSFQLQHEDTTVRLAFDYQEMVHLPGGSNFLAADGSLFTGAGRKESYFAPNGMEDFDYFSIRAAMLHKFSSTWEMKFQATHQRDSRLGGVLLRNNVNWNTRMIRFTARKNESSRDEWAVQGDVLGHYALAGIKNQSAFGFSMFDNRSDSAFVASAAFGQQSRSVDDPRMNEVIVPQAPQDYLTPVANPGSRSKTTGGDIYYQHTMELLADRLILVGGITWSNSHTNNISNVRIPTTSDIVKGDDLLHRLGVVFKIRKDLAVYAMQSTTTTPTAARGADGNLFGPQEGKANEIGLKSAFLEGRISTTLSFFDIELSNVSVFGGTLPNGINFNVPIGRTTQKGFDFDVAFSLTPAWQVIATGFKGDVRDHADNRVTATYGSMWSLFTRYDFSEGSLQGWSIGGGASRIGDRVIATGTNVTFLPGQEKAFLVMKPGTMTTAFVAYKTGPWLFRLNVENVLDEAFPMGAQQPLTVDPSPPRTFSLSATYRF